MERTDGVYIAFSTSPRETAIDIGDTGGPFARALAIELARPGQNHREVFASIRKDVLGETRSRGLGLRMVSLTMFTLLTRDANPRPIEPPCRRRIHRRMLIRPMHPCLRRPRTVR
jgi:hypothetical protein